MHDLDIIKIDECLVAKNLLTNVTKTNEHLNVVTFVRALVWEKKQEAVCRKEVWCMWYGCMFF